MVKIEINIKAYLEGKEEDDIKGLRALPMHELLTILYQDGRDMSRQIKVDKGEG